MKRMMKYYRKGLIQDCEMCQTGTFHLHKGEWWRYIKLECTCEDGHGVHDHKYQIFRIVWSKKTDKVHRIYAKLDIGGEKDRHIAEELASMKKALAEPAEDEKKYEAMNITWVE